MNIEGVFPILTLQTIIMPQLHRMTANVGNTLSLCTATEPLLHMNVTVDWRKLVDDVRVMKFCRDVVELARERAGPHGWSHDFLYINYATEEDDVIASYERNKKEKLLEMAGRYDPQGVCRKSMPRTFSLWGRRKMLRSSSYGLIKVREGSTDDGSMVVRAANTVKSFKVTMV